MCVTFLTDGCRPTSSLLSQSQLVGWSSMIMVFTSCSQLIISLSLKEIEGWIYI